MKNSPLILLITFVLSFCTACSDDDTSQGSSAHSAYETEIIKLINEHRKGKGLVALQELEAIKSQTDAHTDYMIGAGKISHDLFDQRKAYLVKNAKIKSIAENVAQGYSTAQGVVNGWLGSSGHRKNIEGNYSHSMITAKKDKNGRWYYTHIFVKL